ncbi:MAG TPA: anti-sigma factor [Solirubrobacterales bacterium]|nr:anti-sigma factor [Solirubrobacterales bacterium]
MSATDHSRWSDDLAAYMLGALDPREAEGFERHLEECERCQEELRWLQPAVQALPEEVARTEPPPQLRESLMAEVRADADAAPAEERAAREGGLLPAWLRGPRRLRLAAGFAVLVIAVAAVAGYEVGRDESDPPPVANTIEREIDGIEVTMVQEGEGGTVRLANLPQPPPGKVLETWVLREGEVESVPPLFVPDRHGRAEATIADMSGVEELMVTEEPQGGSEVPTGEPVMAMAVPQ